MPKKEYSFESFDSTPAMHCLEGISKITSEELFDLGNYSHYFELFEDCCVSLDSMCSSFPAKTEIGLELMGITKVLRIIHREMKEFGAPWRNIDNKSMGRGGLTNAALNGHTWDWYLALEAENHPIMRRYNELSQYVKYSHETVNMGEMKFADVEKLVVFIKDFKEALVAYDGGQLWHGKAIESKIEKWIPHLEMALQDCNIYFQLSLGFIESSKKAMQAIHALRRA